MATDYQANIDALEEGLGNPELIVQMPDGRRVQYRTVTEIRQAIAYNQQKLAEAAGKKSRTTYASFGPR
jgi:hypothetical protein